MEDKPSWAGYWGTLAFLLIVVIGFIGMSSPRQFADLRDVVILAVGIGLGIVVRLTYVQQREAHRKETH